MHCKLIVLPTEYLVVFLGYNMKLHIGCGKRFIPGFVHIDIDAHPHLDYVHDIRTLPMIKNNSVELIYFCHGIEYFDRAEVKDVLLEWRRVLKSRGILRLSMPDFEALVRVYLKYKDLDKIIGPLYGKWNIVTKRGEKNTIYHKTVYDFKSVQRVLRQAGFKQVKRYDWRKTEHAQYDDYSQAYVPHMDKEKGILISLNVEATR